VCAYLLALLEFTLSVIELILMEAVIFLLQGPLCRVIFKSRGIDLFLKCSSFFQWALKVEQISAKLHPIFLDCTSVKPLIGCTNPSITRSLHVFWASFKSFQHSPTETTARPKLLPESAAISLLPLSTSCSPTLPSPLLVNPVSKPPVGLKCLRRSSAVFLVA